MATSRSCGGTSVTSRSPIVTRPALGVSSPAIMRSAVLLPQPDGPTSTMNSPSAMARSTPRAATCPLGYVFHTCSSRTDATLSP